MKQTVQLENFILSKLCQTRHPAFPIYGGSVRCGCRLRKADSPSHD